MTPLKYLKGTKLLSYRAFVCVQILSWVYTLIWVSALLATWVYWDSLSMYWKVGVSVALIIATPTGSDLIQSYREYKAHWDQVNPQVHL